MKVSLERAMRVVMSATIKDKQSITLNRLKKQKAAQSIGANMATTAKVL